MTISISDINKPQVNTSANTTSINKDNNRPTNTNSTGQANDSITLTESAKLIQQLEKQLGSVPVVDSDKVAEVRENLNSGNYSISTERVAEKFVRYESFLLQAS